MLKIFDNYSKQFPTSLVLKEYAERSYVTPQMGYPHKGGAKRAKKYYFRRKQRKHDNAENGAGERKRCGLDESQCFEVGS